MKKVIVRSKMTLNFFFFVSTLHDYESNGTTNYFLGEKLRTCKISFFSEYTPIKLWLGNKWYIPTNFVTFVNSCQWCSTWNKYFFSLLISYN